MRTNSFVIAIGCKIYSASWQVEDGQIFVTSAHGVASETLAQGLPRQQAQRILRRLVKASLPAPTKASRFDAETRPGRTGRMKATRPTQPA
jgi:hypothetical protein